MPKVENIKIIRVFLAYSGDANEERKIAEEIIDDVNRVTGKLFRCRLEKFWWEYEPPSAGRPQNTLNPHVDECDLFIGMLGVGWGQPPTETKHTSGFEEEFDRALKRNQKIGSPDIWLFLRAINLKSVSDPGDQLKKNLRFREMLDKTKIVSYRMHDGTIDFFRKLTNYLTQYVHDKNPIEELISGVEGNARSPKNISETQLRESEKNKSPFPSKGGMPEQLISLTESFYEDIRIVDANEREEDYLGSKRFDISRLYLLFSVLLADYHTGELIPTHNINLLYLDKERLKATPNELTFLFRTILGNQYAPGWYWFKDFDKQTILNKLLWHATEDIKSNVKKAAIERLKEGRISLGNFEGDRSITLNLLLSDETESVLTEAIEYLGTVGNKDDLDAFDTALTKDFLNSQAGLLLKINITANFDVTEAFRQAIDQLTEIPSFLYNKFEYSKDKIKTEFLEKSIYHKDEKIALFSLENLWSQKAITPEKLIEITNKGTYEQKFNAIKYILSLDIELSPQKIRDQLDSKDSSLLSLIMGEEVDDLVYLSLFKQNESELKTHFTWLNENGHIAYKLLAVNYFSSFYENIISDLDDEFRSFEEHSKQKYLSDIGNLALEKIEEKEGIVESEHEGPNWEVIKKGIEDRIRDYPENISSFIRDKFIAAALAGIAVNGTKDLIVYGRKFMNSENRDIQIEAINIVQRFGDSDDIDNLVKIANDGTYKVAEKAAQIALELSPGIEGVAKTFLSSNSSSLICLSLNNLKNENPGDLINIAEPLLNSSVDIVRRDTFVLLAKTQRREVLESVLSKYISQGNYYYDVVCRLDRLLFAPEVLTARLKEKLAQKIQ
ncbi:MAG: DUF4062 domain-containing protein [candidate division Zixibacteria bacterium]